MLRATRLTAAAGRCALHHARRTFTSTTTTAATAATSAAPSSSRPRIVSGIQPSGVIHLGNYLGAVQNWVKLQNGTFRHTTTSHATTSSAAANSQFLGQGEEVELFLFLADWHALTTTPDPAELDASRMTLAAQLLACGIDPNKSTLFVQSHVRDHLELSWIFSCLTPHTQLSRMTQFKTKSQALKDPKSGPGGKEAKTPSLGLFSYPVLQAADILLYQAVGVPVGEDQFQHVELCRDIATLYNNRYGTPAADAAQSQSDLAGRPPPFQFPTPVHIATPTARVMSLRDGTKKMSKSDAADASRINLTDGPDLIAKKINKAKTDSIDTIAFDRDARPEMANLLAMYSSLTDRSIESIVNDPALSTKKLFKASLTEHLVGTIEPIRLELARIEKDEGYVRSVLHAGAAKARVAAEETMRHVKRAVRIGEVE